MHTRQFENVNECQYIINFPIAHLRIFVVINSLTTLTNLSFRSGVLCEEHVHRHVHRSDKLRLPRHQVRNRSVQPLCAMALCNRSVQSLCAIALRNRSAQSLCAIALRNRSV
jgi:hypothetical protein